MPARTKPDARRSARYQARISLDDRDGPLWERIEHESERARPKTMLYLMRLGMAAERALTSAAAQQPAQDPDRADVKQLPDPLDGSLQQLSRIRDYNLDAFSI